MDPLVQTYLDYCAKQRHPLNTMKARRRVLEAAPTPSTATRDSMERWWNTRLAQDPPLAPATLAADLAILRKFYRWMDVWEHRDPNTAHPISRCESPKVDRAMPRPLSSSDLITLLDVLPPDLGRAVRLGAWAGLRVSEAAALPWRNVDIEERLIRVENMKDGGWRAVAVDWALIDALLPRTGRNVVSGSDSVFSASALDRRVNRAIAKALPPPEDAQGERPPTFHQLRHRYGTLAWRATGDLLGVGRAMGHRASSSTQVYAEPSDDVARKIAAAVVR